MCICIAREERGGGCIFSCSDQDAGIKMNIRIYTFTIGSGSFQNLGVLKKWYIPKD